MAWHVEIGAEFFGPLSSAELLRLYRAGEIDEANLVRRSEIRPIKYYKVSEILGEIEPNEIKKECPEAPAPFVPFTPRHAQLRYGHKPEYLRPPQTKAEQIEEVNEFLQRFK
jgi:hypothetical protein